MKQNLAKTRAYIWHPTAADEFKEKVHTLPLLTLLLIISLAACTSAPAPESTPPVSDKPNTAQLSAIMNEAARSLRHGNLDHPPEDNAAHYYRLVLALAPGHLGAKRGLEAIVERYLGRTRDAINTRRWASARSMLARARQVDPDHPGIQPMLRNVELLSSAKVSRVELTAAQVRDRSIKVNEALTTLAYDPRKPTCRTRLLAGNDTDARWLYAQLNKLPGSLRIRSEIVIATPPAIEVMCFDDS